jgi:outer membrane protein assembly factor BamB
MKNEKIFVFHIKIEIKLTINKIMVIRLILKHFEERDMNHLKIFMLFISAIFISASLTGCVNQSTNTGSTADIGTATPEITKYAADWPLPNKDYNNSRATTDSTINSNNVNTLKQVWSYNITGIGDFGGAATNPLILDSKVYFQDLKGNVIVLDLNTGNEIWSKIYNDSYIEGPNGPVVGYGKVFVAKDIYNISALNMSTGEELWSTRISYVKTTGIDIQPTVYDGIVYAATVPGTGDIFYAPGGIGVIYALDQKTGDILWNFSTVKDGKLWGHPEVNSGGGCWYTPSIDTTTGIMFWASANPAPFAGATGWPSGSSFDTALYSDTLLALDHKTGEMKWYTQVAGHDIWDHDLQISPILGREKIGGIEQDVVIGAGKMGNVYAFNRESGRLLWKVPVGEHLNDYLDPITTETKVLPGILGGVETNMAYKDGIVYVPVVNMHTNYTPTGYNASSIDFFGGTGELVAINAQYGHIIWKQDLPSINVGAATVVNDIVFTGDFSGMIYAFDAKTGEELFTHQAPAGINGWPAVTNDMIIWPAGFGANASLIALKLGGI